MFASLLATVAVIGLISAYIRKYQSKKEGKFTDVVPISKLNGYYYAFAAGMVTANGLFHFLHGVLGYGEFPAPYAKVIGNGIPTDISNIVWGLFNFAGVFYLIMRCRKSIAKWKLVLLLIIGASVMGLLLRFVLLAGYFETHPF